jgi:selenocysteine lyase/cysteine desulfurase
VRALTRHLMDRLVEIGWPSITPVSEERRGAMVCVPSRASGPLSQELMKRDIVTSNRDDNLRVCLHFYNNDEDVNALVEALRELRPQFAATDEGK